MWIQATISVETPPIWTDRDRTRTKGRKAIKLLGFYRQEQFGCKHVLVFKKEKSDLKGYSEASGHCHQGPQDRLGGRTDFSVPEAGPAPPFNVGKLASLSFSAPRSQLLFL